MREYLFRGKDKKGVWRYGHLVESDTDNYHAFIVTEADWEDSKDCKGLNATDFYEVDPETVGQFTGIKMNNSEIMIFEDDIIEMGFGGIRSIEGKMVRDYRAVYTVMFINGQFFLSLIKGYNRSDTIFTKNIPRHRHINEIRNGQFTVKYLGNTHDNPELLEG